MSPILVRPVREQLEHDRIIRLLYAKTKRKHDAGMNPGAERNTPVGTGDVYPDLVLFAPDRGRRVETIVEVETGESVNHLEALAEWAPFARVRAAFHLYVPSQMVDVARRLCEDNKIHVHEVWSYHTVGDEIRFTLVQRTRDVSTSPRSTSSGSRARAGATRKKPASKPVAKTPAAKAKRPAPKAAGKSKPAAKPARTAKGVKRK